MARTLNKLTEDEMQELADKLIKMKFKRAMGHTRRLDPDSHLEVWRVGYKDEIQTRYRLPNLGVRVTLVEMAHTESEGEDTDRLKYRPRYVEARVESLDAAA